MAPHIAVLSPDGFPRVILPPQRLDFDGAGIGWHELTAHSETALLVSQEITRSDSVKPWMLLAFTLISCIALYSSRCQWSVSGPPLSLERDKQRFSSRVSPPYSSQWWLGWLTLATAFLFIFQLVLGVGAGALTLLADLGHTAGDVATYAFGYFVEVGKADLSRRSLVSSHIAAVDTAAASVSVAVVVGTSLAAMTSALARLHKHAAKQNDRPETEFRHIGRALISFGCLNLAMNIGLLVMHRRLATETPSRSSPASGGTPSPEQHWRQRKSPQAGTRGSFTLADVELICVPCTDSPADETVNSPSMPRQRTSENRIDWLHMAFHPGCSHGSCNHGGRTALSPSTSDKSEERTTNLNVYGALLHVATDVFRSLVIFVAGILIQIGILRDAAWADAVCAILVGCCVILGSAAMMRVAIGLAFSPSTIPRSHIG
jgi:Co/Zn/Cd efflux system component